VASLFGSLQIVWQTLTFSQPK